MSTFDIQWASQAATPGDVTPQPTTDEAGFFCRLWRVVRDERDELILANKALAEKLAALDAELTALRARVAERDASVAWAVRRGRRT